MSASRPDSPTGASSPTTSTSPASAPTCATARRRSACTCCAGCCAARTPISELRLFVALDPAAPTCATLAARREELLGGHAELRLPPAKTLHLTLAFLGRRPAGELAAIEAAALGAVVDLPRAQLRAGEVVPLPRRRPRLLALDLFDPVGEAAEIAAAVGRSLEAGGLHRPERRVFWPHMTLARVRSAGRQAGRSTGEFDLPTGLGLGADEDLVFDRVAVYRSQLSPAGARYEALAHVELSV